MLAENEAFAIARVCEAIALTRDREARFTAVSLADILRRNLYARSVKNKRWNVKICIVLPNTAIKRSASFTIPRNHDVSEV